MKGSDFDERIAWRHYADISHMVVLSHRAVDVETKRHGVTVRKSARHHEVKAIRLDRRLSGQALNQCYRIVGILIRVCRRDHDLGCKSNDAGQEKLTPRQSSCRAHLKHKVFSRFDLNI